jgi:hypothetical protein
MKNILTLLIAFHLMVSSVLAAAPLGVSGQSSATKQYPSTLQLSNNNVTKIAGGKSLLETDNDNILVDGSFEGSNSTSAWTSTGTLIADNTPIHGLVNGLVTLAAQSLTLTQDSTLYASQYADGVNGIAFMKVRTTIDNIYLCARKAGVTQITSDGIKITSCVKAPTSGKWETLQIPTILGGTSNGVALVSLTPSTGAAVAVTGDVEWDNAKLRTLDIALGQAACFEAACTTVFSAQVSAAGVVSGENVDFINGNAAIATSNFTLTYIAAMSPYGTNTAAMNCVANSSPNNINGQVLSTATTNVVVQTYVSSTGGASANPSLIVCTKSGADYVAAEKARSFGFYSSTCGLACIQEFDVFVSQTGVVSGENVDFINSNCVVGSGLSTCTYNTSLALTTPMICTAVTDNYHISMGGSPTGSTTNFQFFTTGSSHTAANSNLQVHCRKTGTDYIATKTIIGFLKGPKSEIYVTGGSGHGSTNTKIRRFTTAVVSLGSDITNSGDSATLGHSFTINTAGTYAITYCDASATQGHHSGVSVNSNQLTTSIGSITDANRVAFAIEYIANYSVCAHANLNLSVGDVVRAHNEGTHNGTTALTVNFRITKVGF